MVEIRTSLGRTLIGTLIGEDSRYSMTKKIASRLLKTIILAIFAFPSIHPGRMGINILFMNANVDLFHDSTKNSSGILTSESNEMDLNILIPVVDNNNHKVVDARFLHAFLQVRRDFTSWIKDRISKYDFIENQDFVLIKYDYLGNLLNDRLPETGESDTQIVAKTDYLLLIDMAKELCMVENNDKGKIARRYFIEKEKELRALKELEDNRKHCLRIPDFSDPAKAARAWADEYEAKVKAEKEAMLALEAKNKVEEEKKIVQAELNTAIDTIKENEPVIDMFKRSIPRAGSPFPPRKPLSLSFRSRLPDPLPYLPDSCMPVSGILITPPASGWDGRLIFACLS